MRLTYRAIAWEHRLQTVTFMNWTFWVKQPVSMKASIVVGTKHSDGKYFAHLGDFWIQSEIFNFLYEICVSLPTDIKEKYNEMKRALWFDLRSTHWQLLAYSKSKLKLDFSKKKISQIADLFIRHTHHLSVVVVTLGEQ